MIDADVNHCFGSIQVAQVIASQIEGIELFSGMSDDLAPLGDNLFFLCKWTNSGLVVTQLIIIVYVTAPQYLVDGIERWSGKTAIKMGKPSKPLADSINAKYNIADPNRVLMVGDKWVRQAHSTYI